MKTYISAKWIMIAAVAAVIMLFAVLPQLKDFVSPLSLSLQAPAATACCGDGGGGGDGPPPYSQSTYYTQGNYYSQSTYYSQGNYYSQGSYYSQAFYTLAEPICTLDADPNSIEDGENSTLTWTTDNADTVTIDQGIGSVDPDGNTSVSPTETTTYTLTATGEGSEVTCEDTITVTPQIPEPVCTLDADPNSIQEGATSTLTWTTDNADTVSIDQGIGSVDPGGNTDVSPDSTTTYTLTATGEGGEVTCEDTVTVTDTPPEPICTLDAEPNAIFSGATSTLTWGTENAHTITIDKGIGSVGVNGTTTVSPTVNTTYTLTATGDGGEVMCSDTITIREENGGPLCDSFTTSKSSVSAGEEFELIWETTDATEVSIDQGVGTVTPDGTATTSVNGNTTFTLTASDGEETVTCTTDVTVPTTYSQGSYGYSQGSYGGGGSNNPYCRFNADKEEITAGEDVELSWNNGNTSDILLEDDRGNELINTDENDEDDEAYDEDEDSLIVNPTRNTTYTLTAIRGDDEDECEVEITMDDEVTVTSTRTQDPLVAGVSLTSVPYMGFDAGPMLTTVFYILLVLWSLGVAYVLVLRREPVFGINLPKKENETTYGNWVASVATTTPEETQATYDEVAEPAVPTNLPTDEGYTPTVGYAAAAYATQEEEIESTLNDVAEEDEQAHEMSELENRAHRAGCLLSSDALRFIVEHSETSMERLTLLEEIIETAKASYPSEDGWVVINKERIMSLFDTDDEHAALEQAEVSEEAPVQRNEPVGASSLAETLVTGNITSAYHMLGENPLFALADAAQDLDAIYRNRIGEHVVVSDLLQRAAEGVPDEALLGAIHALTSAVDGTYSDEAAAVRLAIMKAVRTMHQ